MPFKSARQARFLWSKKPSIAQEFSGKKYKARKITPSKTVIKKRMMDIKSKRNDS